MTKEDLEKRLEHIIETATGYENDGEFTTNAVYAIATLAVLKGYIKYMPPPVGEIGGMLAGGINKGLKARGTK